MIKKVPELLAIHQKYHIILLKIYKQNRIDRSIQNTKSEPLLYAAIRAIYPTRSEPKRARFVAADETTRSAELLHFHYSTWTSQKGKTVNDIWPEPDDVFLKCRTARKTRRSPFVAAGKIIHRRPRLMRKNPGQRPLWAHYQHWFICGDGTTGSELGLSTAMANLSSGRIGWACAALCVRCGGDSRSVGLFKCESDVCCSLVWMYMIYFVLIAGWRCSEIVGFCILLVATVWR